MQALNVTVTCPVCHETHTYQDFHTRVYCSKKCADRAYNIYRAFKRKFAKEIEMFGLKLSYRGENGPLIVIPKETAKALTHYTDMPKRDHWLFLQFDSYGQYYFNDPMLKAILLTGRILLMVYEVTNSVATEYQMWDVFTTVRNMLQKVETIDKDDLYFPHEESSDIPF